ncbi:MAG TPA: hypothetical protein VHE54_19615, partial [Puia sp.]|nr:hypothetical protein [Puia sp.]
MGRLIGKDWFVLLLFTLVTFALYFPVLGNGFLIDDYAALYRILVEKRILFREFLRPLIDISFYFNWLYSGLHPAGYYIFNFAVHILVCFMTWKVARLLPIFSRTGGAATRQTGHTVQTGGAATRQSTFALVSGLLFALYPFHNESIVWLSGRLSSMAALCAMTAIYLALTKRAPWDFVLPALLLIIGLFSYESILPLPLIILVWQKDLFRDRKKITRAVLGWAAVGVVCIAIRYLLAGSLLPEYGLEGMEGRAGNGIFMRLIKAFGRSVLPPSDASGRMMLLFAIVAGLVILLHMRLWRRRAEDGFSFTGYTRLCLSFVLAMAMPVIGAVSTRTSEGDRLLYFPSCFLCMMAAALVLRLAAGKGLRWSLVVLFAAGGLLLIEENNRHWLVASRTAGTILDTLAASPAGKTVLINAPDEYEGAFIFRNNFEQALTIHGIPASDVLVNNYLLRKEALSAEGPIGVTGAADSLHI